MFKAAFLPIILFGMVICGCEKRISVDDMGLIGSWQLIEQTAAMNPEVFHQAANTEVLKFANSNYQVYNHDTLTNSGFYTIVEDSTVEQEVCLVFTENYYSRRIHFSGMDNSRKTFYNQNGDTLRLISGCYAYDAGSTKVYARMKESEGTGD
jgi:hypothetical protein